MYIVVNTQFNMRGLWVEVNNFFSSTSIHGFPYISDAQSKSTRIIWTISVLLAFLGASYFLYHTIDGFDEKYVSTTIESRSIQEFPFPAVTFHSGDYNSKNGFLKSFLNQFDFTRYNKRSYLFDNNVFLDLYEWLVSPMIKSIRVRKPTLKQCYSPISIYSLITQALKLELEIWHQQQECSIQD